jgi:hypothetical protein
MKTSDTLRFKAQLTIWLVAELLTLAITFLFSVTLHASGQDVPATAFATFGVLTLLMAYIWVRVDARKAFAVAIEMRQVSTDGTPPHITYISRSFPQRWLVLLYVQLHPELIDSDFG